MSINRPDFKKWTFRINLTITGIVFFILSPTVRIYRSWFPDKTDHLWLYPFAAVGISAILWFSVSLCLPFFIRVGLIKDLRAEGDSSARFEGWGKYRRMLMPIFVTVFQLLLMLIFAVMMIRFLETEPFKKLYTNLP